jgi:DNA-binding transcriptional MocR family regulator
VARTERRGGVGERERGDDGDDAEAIAAAATQQGIGLDPMSAFRAGGAAGPPELVFGYAAHPEPSLRRAVAEIGHLLRG